MPSMERLIAHPQCYGSESTGYAFADHARESNPLAEAGDGLLQFSQALCGIAEALLLIRQGKAILDEAGLLLAPLAATPQAPDYIDRVSR